jgi:hypothetical protein
MLTALGLMTTQQNSVLIAVGIKSATDRAVIPLRQFRWIRLSGRQPRTQEVS